MPAVALGGLESALWVPYLSALDHRRSATPEAPPVLLLYVPYFFRDERFFILPNVLNDVIAAILLARGLSAVRSMLRTR